MPSISPFNEHNTKTEVGSQVQPIMHEQLGVPENLYDTLTNVHGNFSITFKSLQSEMYT